MSKSIASLLGISLANTYCLYLKTQNYHWNVSGAGFAQLHKLFEEQYTALAEAVDLLAERIRALGHKSPGSFKSFMKLMTLNEAKENIPAKKMIEDLAKSHESMAHHFSDSIEKQKLDVVTEEIFIERAAFHEKTAWMLKALLE